MMEKELIEEFMKKEILMLSFKKGVVKKTSRKFQLTLEEAENIYAKVRPETRKSARKKAWTYLFLGSVSLGIGLGGVFSKSGYIMIGSLLVGSGSIISAIGFFRLSLTN